MNLYERLRKEHYLYCQGKKPSKLKLICKYIEDRIKGKITRHEFLIKHGYVSLLNRRVQEIIKLLGLEKEVNKCNNTEL